MTRPLDGVRIVELAEQGFVPSGVAVLADWGADVVKVERPKGDGLRAVMPAGLVPDAGDFDYLVEQFNRNKRNLCLDLGAPGGRDALLRLVEQANVFVTNQLPQVRRKFEIEPEDLFKINPRLVYARGHGQGQQGPDAEAGGYDSVSYWSRSGMGHMMSAGKDSFVMQRPAMGDVPSGIVLAGGIAAGLVHVARTGEGTVVDVSLLACGMWTLAPDLVATSILGEAPDSVSGSATPRSPLVGQYRTRDGRWLMMTMLEEDKYWVPVCRAFELDELAEDPELATAELRRPHGQELRARFEETLAAQDLAYWRPRFEHHGLIYAAFAEPSEVLADPQVEANNYLMRHPDHEAVRLIASPVQFDNEAPTVRRPAPDRGQHTDEVLGEGGLSADEIAALARRGGARMTDAPVGVGLIGCGNIGQIHADGLAKLVEDGEMRAVAAGDPSPDALAGANRNCSFDVSTTVPGEVVDHPEVEAVLVASPTGTHADLVARVVAAGKPLLCEKPLAPSFDDVSRIVASVIASGITAQVGFHQRFHPLYRWLAEVVSAGRFGTPMAYSLPRRPVLAHRRRRRRPQLLALSARPGGRRGRCSSTPSMPATCSRGSSARRGGSKPRPGRSTGTTSRTSPPSPSSTRAERWERSSRSSTGSPAVRSAGWRCSSRTGRSSSPQTSSWEPLRTACLCSARTSRPNGSMWSASGGTTSPSWVWRGTTSSSTRMSRTEHGSTRSERGSRPGRGSATRSEAHALVEAGYRSADEGRPVEVTVELGLAG